MTALGSNRTAAVRNWIVETGPDVGLLLKQAPCGFALATHSHFPPSMQDDVVSPNRPLNQPSDAAVQLPQTSRSCIVQHFCRLKAHNADVLLVNFDSPMHCNEASSRYLSPKGVWALADQPHLLRTYGDTDFITGLRAIAATMVVIIHTGMLAEFGTVGQAITNAGKYGVDIFFVISGFTIAKTFAEARDYRSYLTRRIMRIVPLYWLMITIAMILWISGMVSMPSWMQELGSQPDLYNYLMHLSMLSYLDYRVANSVLGVEWTIPIEVFWYICLPPLIYFGKTIPRAISMILALVILTALLSYVSKKLFGTSLPIKWSPIAHGHLFFIGVISYYLRDRFQLVGSRRPVIWIFAAVVLFALAMVVDFGGRSELLAISTAILIVYVTPARAAWVTTPLTARPMLFLGSISYSIYLIHTLVIHILGDASLLPANGIYSFIVVYGITIMLSTVTYLLVEMPTNQAGRRMVVDAQ